ncbi:hypothetical protein ATANTOWER_000510 [Ataeniobius toweri]|uniref:Uncharacterized protein n=1 Tax=Ataeniobius toweri TaxID=208326 RepID=A0ABU7B1A8_9TELE|nr:hypothetical protein [Ataeniobius toweri]
MEDQWGEQSLAATYVDVTYCRGRGTMDVMQAIPSSPLTYGVLALFPRGDTLPPDKVHAASGCTCTFVSELGNLLHLSPFLCSKSFIGLYLSMHCHSMVNSPRRGKGFALLNPEKRIKKRHK